MHAHLLRRITLSSLFLAAWVAAAGNAAEYKLETVVDKLDHPWSIAFLPNGDYLISFLGGELRQVSSAGKVGQAIENAPATYVKSQGGFFDIVLDPDFASNQTIYLAFAQGTPESNATRVIRAQLSNNSLENVETIFTVKDRKNTPAHYGGKLLFLPDATLLLTTGDGFEYREAAQDPFSQLGKVVRFNSDGSVPSNNPFADGKRADPYVYTLGHRSPQGLAYDSVTDQIFMHEHGPQGGDEVNILSAGSNYGWPVTSYGINYSGALVTPFTTLEGIVEPIKYWRPSIAPAGLTVYAGNAFPDWKGDLFIGALVDKEVRQLKMAGDSVASEHTLFSEVDQRVRSVSTGPDGFIYLLTETKGEPQGKLIRVQPK